MIAFRDNSDREAPAAATAPCGPECRFARRAGGCGTSDYVWCELKGAPLSTGPGAVDCGWFRPHSDAAPVAAKTQR